MVTQSVENLLDLHEEDFRSLVDEEVRVIGDKNDEQQELAQLLRDHRVVERWYLTLIQMKKSVESQLGSKKADLAKLRPVLLPSKYEAKLADYNRWRAGALRFKSGVEDRLIEIRSRRLRHVPTSEDIKEQRNWALAVNMRLVDGILEHKKAVTNEYSDDISDADLALWELVKNLP